MKISYKISFLIAAHNEEKLIGKALKRLVHVSKDYPNIEVLIGLDGCTDKTPEISREFAEKHEFFRIFEMNERAGKQAVLDKLQPHIKGDIVVIHDADWSFVYKSKKDLLDFLSLFNNQKVGGVADSIEAEMSKPNFWKINSLGFLASAWGNHFLMEYCKDRFTTKREGLEAYDIKKMKFCPWLDTYRKSAMDKTKHDARLRAGDHIERTIRLMRAGYYVLSFRNKNWPHFNVNYNEQSINDLINQKIRGSVSKRKIKEVYGFQISLLGFYIPFLFYVIRKSFFVKRAKDFAAVWIYLAVMVYSNILAKLKQSPSAKKVWSLRSAR